MIIPSKPGKPKILAVTHHHVLLEWSKPERGAHNIIAYTIFYRCTTNDSHGVWGDYKIVTKEKAIVSQLSENTIYHFKIRPECKAGVGLESDISEPVRTKVMIPSQPGKPRCSNLK